MRTVVISFLLLLVCGQLGLRISVVEGESMAPAIRAGDTVLTIAPIFGAPQRGSILLVETDRRRILHRLHDVSGTQLWLKGDASANPDTQPVRQSQVRGVLALLFPTSYVYRVIRAAAEFTARVPIQMELTSAGGAIAEQGPRYTFGADSLGRLAPGAYALWSVLLSACHNVDDRCAESYALRIDPQQFSALIPASGSPGSSAQALSRALRIATRCQSARDGGAWVEAADLFTAEWRSDLPSSGLLALQPAAAVRAGVRCEVKITLLGSFAASLGSITIPLRWGPA